MNDASRYGIALMLFKRDRFVVQTGWRSYPIWTVSIETEPPSNPSTGKLT